MAQRRIILASQCDADRALLEHILTSEGFAVTCVTDAPGTLAAAQGLTDGAVILDTLCWQSGALNTLTALKRQAGGRQVPVLIFGQPRTVEEVSTAAQAGAAAWLDRRGFTLAAFLAKVKALTGASQGAATATAPTPTTADVAPSSFIKPNDLEPLTESRVREVLSGLTDYSAYEFSIVDAITTISSKRNADAQIAEIVEHDPVLTLATLAWAAQHGESSTRRTADTREALVILGNREFYRRVEGLTPLRFDNSSIWDPGAFWLHSVATARIAAMLSRAVGLGLPGEAFNAGMLADIGFYLLATHLPLYFGRLFTIGIEADTISPKWEEDLIGADHGSVGNWTLAALGLPETLQNAVRHHHHAQTAVAPLSHSSQVLVLLTQAAGQLTDALFPGDPPLTHLAPLNPGFRAALDQSNTTWERLVAQARAMMNDLLTEMSFLLPQARNRSYYHKKKPLVEVLYHAPKHPAHDIIHLYLSTRAEKVTAIPTATNRSPAHGTPLVVNLTHMRDVSAQIEVLTSLLAVGLLNNRKTAVLLPEPPRKALLSLLPDVARATPVPAHAARWLKWLARPASADATSVEQLVAAQ